jgi:rhamnulokinase
VDRRGILGDLHCRPDQYFDYHPTFEEIMAAFKNLLAFDYGAESGRAIIGTFDGNMITLDVVHRFPNRPVKTLGNFHWDALDLYREMLEGIRIAASQASHIDGIGVDTWGVDFALLAKDGSLLGNPRHYRDQHTENILELAFQKMPKETLYRNTGIQFMRFNSLFQLLALQRDRSSILESAKHLLFMPDLFNYFLTGIKVNEYSDASTSQMIDPNKRAYSSEVLKAFGIAPDLLGTLVQPGTVLGPLRQQILEETGINAAPVIAPATHDTASAVAAVPAGKSSWAYISSGTWSLMGIETLKPQMTEKALAYNFTNEGGVKGTTRLLKNIMGLWLVQECRRSWIRSGKEYGYEELTRLAAEAAPFESLIHPDDDSFIVPLDMPKAIAAFCNKTGQKSPSSPGAFVRCALESLAVRYRWVMEKLEELSGEKIETIHVVGGGCQNALLCQFTADACNRTVVAGPSEATAVGNVLMQAMGLGLLSSLAEAREVVKRSFPLQTFTPKNPERWQEPYERVLKFMS